jgi:hypothetical protein
MDANEAFEQEAELFYKDTGFLAPGKSESPAACGQTDFERYEVRQLLKRAWDAGRRRPEPPRREAEQRVVHAAERAAPIIRCSTFEHCGSTCAEKKLGPCWACELKQTVDALTPAKGKEKCNRAVDPGNHEDCTACFPPKASKEK